MLPFAGVSSANPGSGGARILCVSCGADTAASSRFCPQCGVELGRTCPACGELTSTGARFCSGCGAPLTTASPRPRPEAVSAPVREEEGAGRRVVTVLFADLVGFTPLAEGEDPEVLREFLSGYFDLARKVITRTGGAVEKFIGDAVMAVWGATTAQQDDAEQAVRAGLELVTEVAAYGEQRGRPGLSTRVGVVTGAVATWARPGEGLVAGDRVNLASRVQAAADPGTVLVDGATREASQAGLEYLAAGTHLLKGISEPVELWRAVRVLARRGGAGRSGSWEAPFVGRARELAWCKDLFHDVSDRRRARLLSITGQAGVGKSRLTWELEKYLDGLQSDTFWHRGRCLAYGDGVAFWPLAEMMRTRLGLQDEESLSGEGLEARIDRGLAALELPTSELPELREALAVLLGVEGAGVERAQLFASWRRIFELLGERGTVVMVIDDCQWADSGLLDFVESLLDWSANAPLLIITLARPELSERHPGWGTGRPTATALALEPLAPEEMSELLEGLVPGLPTSTIARIVGAAEGIPLYAVELVRALAERGNLARRGERYAVVGEFETLPVPASLTALLAARLDTLSPRSRALASRLSVFAGAIPPAAARAVAGMAEAEMETSLAELRRAEVLAVRTDALAADRGQFVFTQGLLRSAAYDRLGRAERRAAHMEAAGYLQSALPDSGLEVAEAVAMHLEAALEATGAGDDATSLRSSAAEAFARAGARARAVGAPASSQRCYQRARRLAPESADAITWQAQAAEAAADAGDYEAALEEAASPVTALDLTSPEGTSLAILRSRALTRQGRTDEAVEELRQALAARADLDPDEQSARLHGEFASLLFTAGELESADAEAELALAEGQAYQVPHAVARGAEAKGWGLAVRGRVEEALLHLEWGARLITANGTLRDQARVTMNVGDLEAQYDRPGAVGHFESAAALCRRAGARDIFPTAVSNLAWVWGLTGRWREAEQLTSELLADLSPVLDRAIVLLGGAFIPLWRGDVEEAARQLAAALPLPSGIEIQLKAAVDGLDCGIKLAQGRPREALAVAEPVLESHTSALGISHQSIRQLWTDAVEAALRCGARELAGRWLAEMEARPPGLVPPYLASQLARLRGLSAADGREFSEADSLLARAADGFERLGYPYWRARAELDRARALAALGDGGTASLAAEAAATFQELGALSWQRDALSVAEVAGRVTAAGPQAVG